MKKVFSVSLCLFSMFIFSQQNIQISNSNTPTEPSICINPNNTNQLIAGSNIRNVYKSNDAGATWTTSLLNSTFGVWGDPTIIVDNSNNFYFFHLSNPPNTVAGSSFIDRIVCQKTTDFGTTWSTGTATGKNGTKAQDKQWSVFDKVNNMMYLTWTQFDVYGSSNPNDKSIIRFSKSSDFGATWSNPLKINTIDGGSIDDSNTVEGAVPAVGPNGQIYVAWASPNKIVFKKSTDFGTTWPTTETLVATSPGWDFSISGLDRANGLPITACDNSPAATNGTIYVNWSDQRNGTDDTDIFISKSTDQGTTWSSPLRVNNDGAGKQQFLTWMTIDQTNGYVYIVFYDRRNYIDNQTDVYLAYSTDGGVTFTNKKISTTPFTPNASVFFGDYTNITAHNGVVRPIWSRMDSGQTSIWTALVSQSQLSTNQFETDEKSDEVTNFPNPVTNDESYFSFKLYKESKVSILIYDASGKEVYKVLDDVVYPMGKHVITLKNKILSKGNYFYTIKSDYFSKSKKMIIN
jgi:hypothetical protein